MLVKKVASQEVDKVKQRVAKAPVVDVRALAEVVRALVEEINKTKEGNHLQEAEKVKERCLKWARRVAKIKATRDSPHLKTNPSTMMLARDQVPVAEKL
jgi:hypothetical protein